MPLPSICASWETNLTGPVVENKDLSLMAAGQMDKSGEGLTKAGKICGIISIALAIIGIIINIVTGGAYLRFHIG